MMSPDCDVVVIGGGVTGCGVARDLAMRGLEVTLLERGALNSGTSGRSHGLLHSGARYADADPESARHCRAESEILKRIAGAAVDDTGGFFVQLEQDDQAYVEQKRDACRACDIDVEEVDVSTLCASAPGITDAVERAFAVPDAVVYPSRLVAATAASAREAGAELRPSAPVTDIRFTDEGVDVEHDRGGTVPDVISARHVVNAAGAWAGRVAALAGSDLEMAPTRGWMVMLEYPGLSAVLNRCRPPADGDIIVPHRRTVVCGTTSEPVLDADVDADPAGVADALRREAAMLIPELADAERRRTFAGTRPIHVPGGREASRGFEVIDHGKQDGRPGLTTVIGGKLTTYRLMAEVVSDHVTDRLDVDEPCRTAEEPLIGHDDADRLDALVKAFDTTGPADRDVVDKS